MAKYPARKGVIYLGTTVGGVATVVIGMSKFSMNRATDKIEVTAFGDSNKTYVQGLPDVKGAFSGFWDDTESKPFTAAAAAGGVNMYLYPSSDAPSKFWSGPAFLDLSMDVDVKGAVALSGSFAASGSWANTF